MRVKCKNSYASNRMTLNTMIMQRFFISLIPNIFITYLQEDEVREGLGYA